MAKPHQHAPDDISNALSLFFAVRGVMRTRLAQGKKLDPSAWLRLETMRFISEHDGPSMRSLAAHLSITAPSATSLVSGLVRDGLVAREIDARDRRASRLVLTAKGKAALARKFARGTELLAPLFAPLSSEELATFTRLLSRLKAGGRE